MEDTEYIGDRTKKYINIYVIYYINIIIMIQRI